VAAGKSGHRISVGVSATLALVIIVIIVGTVLRFGYLLHYRTQFQIEMAAYESNAIFRGRSGSFDWTLRLGPLPRLLQSTVLMLSGERILPTALLEAILATGICVPVFLLSKQLYPAAPGSGLTAVVVYAFHPQAIVYCCFFLDHQTATALAAIAFALLAHTWTPTSSRWRTALCGGTLGLLGLSRVIMSAIVTPLVSRMALCAKVGRPVLLHTALFALVAIGFVAPWVYRQSRATGGLVPVSSGGGVTLLWGTLLDYSKPRYLLQPDILRIVDEMRARYGIEMIAAGPRDDAQAARLALARIWTQPRRWLTGVFYKMGAFWYSDHTPRRTWLNLVVNVPLLILGAVGAVARYARREGVAFVITALLAADLAHAVFHSMAQYSTPLLPLLCALASGPLAAIARQAKHWFVAARD